MSTSKLSILFAVFLASCGWLGPSRTCKEIAADGLRAVIQHPTTVEVARAEVAKVYDIPTDSIDTQSYGLGWTKDGVDGGLAIEASGRYLGSLKYWVRQPSAEAVIRCLGTPDKYRAWYHFSPNSIEHTLEFEMFFLKLGVSAMVQQRAFGKESPRPSGATTLIFFVFVPVDSPEETESLLTEGLSHDLREQIKPWPGKWEDIVIEIDPALRP